MQNHLNLIYREEEREMLPLCRAEGIGVIPYSPLASGRLLTTAALRAFQPSVAQACTMASMLEPRPEIRTTMFFMPGPSFLVELRQRLRHVLCADPFAK
jgi:hypothetical protein